MLIVSNSKHHPSNSMDRGRTESAVSTMLASQVQIMEMLTLQLDKLERMVMSPVEEQWQDNADTWME